MKFGDLRPGEQFEFAGRHYRKSGPLTASPVDGDSSTMIPRSAGVTLLSEPDRPGTEVPTQVAAEDAAQAIEALYRLARQAVDRLEDDSAASDLDAARQRWRTKLGLDP